jgi:octaprenyl-diphosphate synthase
VEPVALKDVYAPVEAELAEVEGIMRRQLQSDCAFVDELVRHGCSLGGKRLRPTLLLLAAKASGQLNEDHLVLAAVVEMIHTATLVHDDVLDEADIRRHLATVNSRWDNEASVLLGDYLFTHSICLASALESTLAFQWIGRATNTVCQGELRQKGTRGDFTLTEEEYLDIIEAKTAALWACSCRLGAHFAGAPEKVVLRLERYGRDVGIAFQIADDLLDLLGDESTAGKSLGSDLQLQKPTLPLIRVLQLADDGQRSELLSILHGDPRRLSRALEPFLTRFQAIAYAREKAGWYARRARQQIKGLSPGPARRALEKLSDFVVARSR